LVVRFVTFDTDSKMLIFARPAAFPRGLLRQHGY
jgi:hypothetical protein